METIVKAIVLWGTWFAWVVFICAIDGMSLLFGSAFLFVNLVLTIICICIIDNFKELNKLSLNEFFEKMFKK